MACLELWCGLAVSVAWLLTLSVIMNSTPLGHSMTDSQKLDLLLGKMTSLEEELRPWLSEMDRRLAAVERQIDYLTQKAEYAEGQDKRMNIIFSGIPEAQGRETWADVEHLIRETVKNKMGINTPLFIQRAHRMRGGPSGQPRRIVVKFGDYHHREEVLRCRRQLAGSSIFVSEHFTRRVSWVRNRLLQEFRGAPVDSQGRRPKLVHDKMWVGQRLYTVDERSDKIICVRDLTTGSQRPQHPNSQPTLSRELMPSSSSDPTSPTQSQPPASLPPQQQRENQASSRQNPKRSAPLTPPGQWGQSERGRSMSRGNKYSRADIRSYSRPRGKPRVEGDPGKGTSGWKPSKVGSGPSPRTVDGSGPSDRIMDTDVPRDEESEDGENLHETDRTL